MTSSFQIFHLESTYVQKDTNTTTSSSSTTTATTTTTTHSLSLQPTSELRESTTSTSPSFTSTSPLFKPDSTPSSLTHSTSPTLIKQNELPSTVPFTIQPSSSLHPTNTLSSSTSPLLPTLSYAQLTQHFQSSLSSSLRKLINDNEPFPASSTSPSSSTLVPLIHSLAQLRQRIHHALQRNFDVVTAIDVIGSGNYCGMPKIMATYLGLEDTSEKPSTSKTIMALNHAILLRLVALECGVPKPLLNNFKIIHGTIQFTVQHEFSVTLTLPGGPDPDGPWHLLDFRILDPTITLQPYQLMNLMRLGQAKLSKGIKEVQVVEEKEKNKHNASTRRTHPVVTFPLLELYHFYHQFVLTLRFENLVLQAHVFRHHESMHILHEGRRLEVLYWTGSVNQGRLRIQLKETIHTHRINVSWHPHVRRPPDPMEEMILPVSTSTSSFTSMLNPTSPPVTVDYTYPVTTLVVDSMDPPLTPVTVTTQTFMELYQHCLQRHTQTLFQHMQGLVPQGVVEKQTYFHVPSHRVRVSVHKKTGGFYVTSSDMYHDQGKIANIEKAINQGLDHLPRSLAHLATSVALDHLETAALFLGFQPSVLPRPLHHVSNDSLGGTLALHSKVQEKELDENRFGPAMFLRVLHLPQHPDYHLAINSLAPQQLTCWVIRSPSNTVVRQYTPKLSSLVQSFKYVFCLSLSIKNFWMQGKLKSKKKK
ncbi:Mediator of RNA polymerase II transcription subunit 14 [Coelomomyces lativittatus]|nr:Mediator of RNA polymerase II transcription subunit 14 [Coelomomyces lativittatus]